MPDDEFPPERPILDYLVAKSLPITYQELRITDLNSMVSPERLENFLKLHCSYYLVGEETAKNHHYHIAMVTDLTKLQFKEFLYQEFNPPKNSKGHEAGNSFFQHKDVVDIEKYFPYCVKDGKVFSNFPDTLIQIAKDISYEKPKGYEIDLQDLYESFQEDKEIRPSDLWEQITLCRSKYDLPINLTRITELVNAQIVKRDPTILKLVKTQIKFIAYN